MKHAPAFLLSPTRFLSLSWLIAVAAVAACSTTPADTPGAGPAAASPGTALPATGGEILTGNVVETMNSGGYSYARLKSDTKEVWIAAAEFPIKNGDRLTVSLEMPMTNFHSTTLNRDFPVVYFVAQVARDGQTLPASPGAAGAPAPMGSHGSGEAAPQAGPVTVTPNAPPAGGLSIADTWAKRESLAGKPITVRGTVVKVNNGIMGVNWFHLQDGSGKAADGTNDLTVTTDAVVKVGDVVTVTGTLATRKDFGAGYAYEAILEKATIK